MDGTCVYVTHNSEYHVRGGRCHAVRSRQTGGWLAGHTALGLRLVCAVRRSGEGVFVGCGAQPSPGDSLLFRGPHRDLVTGALREVVLPARLRGIGTGA